MNVMISCECVWNGVYPNFFQSFLNHIIFFFKYGPLRPQTSILKMMFKTHGVHQLATFQLLFVPAKTENRARFQCTFLQMWSRRSGRGGVGEHVNVPWSCFSMQNPHETQIMPNSHPGIWPNFALGNDSSAVAKTFSETEALFLRAPFPVRRVVCVLFLLVLVFSTYSSRAIKFWEWKINGRSWKYI